MHWHRTVLFVGLMGLILVSLGTVSGEVWISNSSIVDGLGSGRYIATPAVYNDYGTLKLIAGDSQGNFYGFYWNGATWVSDSNIVSGLGDVGEESKPTVFNDSGTLKLISGEYYGAFYGFYWNGATWVSDSSIITGLGDVGKVSSPVIFNDSGTLKLISGEYYGAFYGFYWNGTGWESNSSIVTGLGGIDYDSAPAIYNDSGTWKLICGNRDGAFYGFYWNGATWVSDSSIITGLGDVGGRSKPTVFNDSGTLKLISGESFENYFGFYQNKIPIISSLKTESQINPIQIITNISSPYFNWTYSDEDGDTQYSWEIQVGTSSGLFDMWDSGQLIGNDTTDIYGGSALSRNTAYYVQVRANDSYENSSWATGTFKINALPIIPNVSIHPPTPVLISNLTSNNGTATDGDGDPITLAYHWYKNGTRVSALTNLTWVYYDNTSTDETWKVGIIPFDGYENGTEVISATVTIGSGNTAPTLTSLTSNQSTKKYGYDIKFMTVGAIDADGDHYILSVGSASGLGDICNSTNVSSPGVANCTIEINWTSGSRSFYGRLYDGIDTSIEYTTIITVDVTPPIVNSSSVNVSSFQQGGSVLISTDIGLANGTITLPKVKIRNPSGVSSNYSLTGDGANGTYTYTFTPPAAGSWVVTNIYASDDSGNTLDESVSHTITVGTTGGGGGGGGGGAPITIIELGNLSLSPDVRHTYFWYTAISGDQMAQYKFVANRNITSCEVAPNDDAVCEIVDGYVVYVTLIVNETVKSYDGLLTVRDEYGYTADAKLIVGVIKLTGALPFFHIDLSLLPDGLIEFLEMFFEVQDKVIVGIRTFLVGGIGLSFFVALFLAYKS